MPRSDYFNSRPCERGFGDSEPDQFCAENFNSRPCERGFGSPFSSCSFRLTISIHAPARGASAIHNAATVLIGHFNSRPCERGFGKWKENTPEWKQFQFTPLREGLQQKSTIFLSVFCCFLFIKYIFQKLILSNSKFNQYRPYICAIFIAPIS